MLKKKDGAAIPQKPLIKEKEAPHLAFVFADRIVLRGGQLRSDPDERSILRLADSIRQYGMITPLLVRRDGFTRGSGSPFPQESFVLISGVRRLRAARLIGLEKVPCLILKNVGDEKLPVVSLIENTQREEIGPFDEAFAIDGLIRSGVFPRDAAARRLSLSQSELDKKLLLLRLSPSERKIFISGSLTPEHAAQALRIDDPAVREAVLRKAVRCEMSAGETAACVTSLLRKNEILPFDADDAPDGIKNGGKAEKVKKPVKEKAASESGTVENAAKEKASGEKSDPVRTFVIRDVKLFMNTVERAVETVKGAGFDADIKKSDGENSVTYSITVAKKPKSA